MTKLKSRVRLWHALLALVAVAALAFGGTAIAGSSSAKRTVEHSRLVAKSSVNHGPFTYVYKTFTLPAGNSGNLVAKCSGGKHVSGGGVRTTGTNQVVNETRPGPGSSGGFGAKPSGKVWQAYITQSTSGQQATVYAICV